jgi:hypothetical protein
VLDMHLKSYKAIVACHVNTGGQCSR